MSPTERTTVAVLAGVYVLRMLGIFMLLPVLALYVADYPDAGPLKLGLALGGYGLSQALLQIPGGLLSDRFGRKVVVIGGLLLFGFASVGAAQADSLNELIVWRILQGSAAISAALLAWCADATRAEQRNRAMAVIGISVGGSFLLALAVAPPLAAAWGTSGIFICAALLTLPALIAVACLPAPQRRPAEMPGNLRDLLVLPGLPRVYVGIFILHALLTGLFVVLPLQLLNAASGPVTGHWRWYVLVIVLSLPAMVGLLNLARRAPGRAILWALAGLLGGLLCLMLTEQLIWLLFGLWLFFCGFNALEAFLPARASRLAPPARKGGVLGIFHSAQFFGSFIGGLAGGAGAAVAGASGVFALGAAVVTLWLIIEWRTPRAPTDQTLTIQLSQRELPRLEEIQATMRAVHGVREVVFHQPDRQIYLGIAPERLDRAALQDALTQFDLTLAPPFHSNADSPGGEHGKSWS